MCCLSQKLEARVERRNRQIASRLAFRSFAVHDVAMFCPIATPSGGTAYIAFNERCPRHYLSQDTVASFRYRGRYPDYVLGRILMIEPHKASAEFNPYHLRIGTQFFILTVERLFGRRRTESESSQQ